jgi:lycopene cyclase domain-containing protein
MLSKFEYLAILIFVMVVFWELRRRKRIKIFKSWKQELVFLGCCMAIGMVWDHLALWRGHWLFPVDRTIGIKLGLMPIEEYLFILIVPEAVVTLWLMINKNKIIK